MDAQRDHKEDELETKATALSSLVIILCIMLASHEGPTEEGQARMTDDDRTPNPRRSLGLQGHWTFRRA